MVKTFQENYRGRMARCYVVNITNFTYVLWKMFKVFLNESTRSKINLFKESYPEEMKQVIHPTQYLKKLGGTMELPERSWPPVITSSEFTFDKSQIMTEDQYIKKLEENPYMIPRPDLIAKFKSTRAPDMIPERELFFTDRVEKRNYCDEIISVRYKKDSTNIIQPPSLKKSNKELPIEPIYEQKIKQKDALSDKDACDVADDTGHHSQETRFLTARYTLMQTNQRLLNKSVDMGHTTVVNKEEVKTNEEPMRISLIRQ